MPCSPPSSDGKAGGCGNCSRAPPTSAAVVPLPSRRAKGRDNERHKGESTPLLWHTSGPKDTGYLATPASSSSSSTTDVDDEDTCPIAGRTASSGDAICCREAQTEERTLIDPDLARDCIVGLSDGLTVPFALTAGLSSVGSSRLVVLAGLAELVSGAISMGIGGFLSAQAELSHFHYHEKNTQQKLLRSCDSEIDRQVEQILKDYGVEKDTCRRVARELRRKEEERRIRLEQVERVKKGARRERRLFGMLAVRHPTASVSDLERPSDSAIDVGGDGAQHVGLTPFILRVGSGLEPVSTSRLYVSALTIGLSYFVGGAIPLLPYVFIEKASQALLVSIVVTGIILLAFGVVKQRVTGGEGGFKGYLYGAVSTLAVGGVAAGASWMLVSLLEKGGD